MNCKYCGKDIINSNAAHIDCCDECYLQHQPIFTIKNIDSVQPVIYRQGWVCPKCGAVMSPDMQNCINCTGKTVIPY